MVLWSSRPVLNRCWFHPTLFKSCMSLLHIHHCILPENAWVFYPFYFDFLPKSQEKEGRECESIFALCFSVFTFNSERYAARLWWGQTLHATSKHNEPSNPATSAGTASLQKNKEFGTPHKLILQTEYLTGLRDLWSWQMMGLSW